MPAVQVDVCHDFPLTAAPGFNVIFTILSLLRAHLPYSLPLYRRLQSGRFFDSSVIISNLRKEDARSKIVPSEARQSGRDDVLQRPWVFAFVDRSCRPETEVLMFGSWEAGDGDWEDEKWAREVEVLVRGIVRVAKGLPVPRSIHLDPSSSSLPADDAAKAAHVPADTKDRVGYSRNDYGGHASNSDIMLWGAVHERTVSILQRLGVVAEQYRTSLVPNHTFVFNVADMPTPPPLPKGLFWGELGPEHFALVKSRTEIPRQDRTMAVLPRLAVYPSKDAGAPPIAWAFVGLDGSLTTLHVEREWRGRGVAKAVTTKLFRECMNGFWEDEVKEKMAHGYVIVGNKESAGMCRSLGGEDAWQCYWVRVDLSKMQAG